jgi:uncharacterized protein (DUF2267 family)
VKEREIARAVSELSGLGNTDHAADATRATLAVLGTRLAGGEPRHLAAQLPAGVAEALPAVGQGATFGVEEFYRRVAEAEGRGCTADGAREHARAVIAALRTGVSEGEFADLEAQLPNDFRTDLLSTAPVDERRG